MKSLFPAPIYRHLRCREERQEVLRCVQDTVATKCAREVGVADQLHAECVVEVKVEDIWLLERHRCPTASAEGLYRLRCTHRRVLMSTDDDFAFALV